MNQIVLFIQVSIKTGFTVYQNLFYLFRVFNQVHTYSYQTVQYLSIMDTTGTFYNRPVPFKFILN